MGGVGEKNLSRTLGLLCGKFSFNLFNTCVTKMPEYLLTFHFS